MTLLNSSSIRVYTEGVLSSVGCVSRKLLGQFLRCVIVRE